MEVSQIYIIIAIVILLVIGAVAFLIRKKQGKKPKQFTPLTNIAFIFIICGILFTDNRFFSYGLFGVGIILAVIDIVMKSKKK